MYLEGDRCLQEFSAQSGYAHRPDEMLTARKDPHQMLFGLGHRKLPAGHRGQLILQDRQGVFLRQKFQTVTSG